MCLINHISDEAQTTKGGEGGKGVSERWGEGGGEVLLIHYLDDSTTIHSNIISY